MIKWRKVEDGLPEKDRDCLVKSNGDEYFVAWYDGKPDNDEFQYSYCCGCICTVTHWIYLQDLLELEGLE